LTSRNWRPRWRPCCGCRTRTRARPSRWWRPWSAEPGRGHGTKRRRPPPKRGRPSVREKACVGLSLEFFHGAVGLFAIDDGRSAAHHDGHADGLDDLGLGNAHRQAGFDVAGDAALAAKRDRDAQGDQFFLLASQGLVLGGGVVDGLESFSDFGIFVRKDSQEIKNGFGLVSVVAHGLMF